MPKSWVKNKSTGKMLLRGLRKPHESLCLGKPEATSLTRNYNENVKALFGKFKVTYVKTQFHSQ